LIFTLSQSDLYCLSLTLSQSDLSCLSLTLTLSQSELSWLNSTLSQNELSCLSFTLSQSELSCCTIQNRFGKFPERKNYAEVEQTPTTKKKTEHDKPSNDH
jgi:hypothetical protein